MNQPRKALRRYFSDAGAHMTIYSDRTVYVQPAWGGAVHAVERKAAAASLNEARRRKMIEGIMRNG